MSESRCSNTVVGRSTVNAKRARLARDEESSTEREAHCSQDWDRYSVPRARKSSVEIKAHLSQDRDRHRIQKAKKSSAKTHINTVQNDQPTK
jgi:hypothetical protein